ncbi:MAG: S8 family serine peptidase [Planctomycetota bacterium]|nr:S8 family serine peptidase [Planctomycetota bacterium]
MNTDRRLSLVLTAAVVCAVAGLGSSALAQSAGQPAAQPSAQPANASGKVPVKTADDLPRHTYKVEGKAGDFLRSPQFAAFADQVIADAKSDLEKYDITDRSTLQEYHRLFMMHALLKGDDDAALKAVSVIRDLEGKESKKLMTGQTVGAWIFAKKAGGAANSDAFKAELKRRIGALPWAVIADEVKQGKGRADIMRAELVEGMIKSTLDPVIDKQGGEVSQDIARQLVTMKAGLDIMLPMNPAISEVYGGLIAANAVVKKDIWAERDIALRPDDKATPIAVCVWDSGVDIDLYKDVLWTNPAEQPNGKDDDNNGYVDDMHGIAYDLTANPVPELLHPLADMRSPVDLVSKYTKGMSDVTANIDSPEATDLKKYIGSLKPDQVQGFMEDLSLYGNYSHGTHVAGIATAGNPFVRLMAARLTFDFRSIPSVTTSIEQAKKDAAAAAATVQYMRKAGVRVVNMSWGGSRQSIEDALEAKGAGGDAKQRAELARELFKIGKDALEKAMIDAPEILFVAAAGNSDNDNAFEETIPSALSAPNLITIGAVDQAGTPTGFTTFGKNVTLYANGFEVLSYVPGGKKMKYSGTSMAAPQVTNLAGKILAIDPSLSSSQVVDVISKTSDPMPGHEGKKLINPKKAIESLKK